MDNRVHKTVLGIVLIILPFLAQATPIDVNGDGKVGPKELLDLAKNWKGSALIQPWQVNGSSIYYNGGRVGIDTTAPQFPLTLYTIMGYGWIHTDGTHEVGSYVSNSGGWLGTRYYHSLHFFTNNSLPLVTLDTSGNLGVGTKTPFHKLEVQDASGGGRVP